MPLIFGLLAHRSAGLVLGFASRAGGFVLGLAARGGGVGMRLLADISITQNSSVPGTSKVESLVGGLMTLGLAGCVAAVVFGGAAWGFGERRANFTAAHHGRRLVEGGLLGAVAIGAAVALVNQAVGVGLGF